MRPLDPHRRLQPLLALLPDRAQNRTACRWLIHTGNGAPFASRAPGGLSRLSINWVKLGILPERSRPACPQDNPTHERMPGTLKQPTLKPPAATPPKQQVVFDHFHYEFGHERPHDGIGGVNTVRAETASKPAVLKIDFMVWLLSLVF